MWPSVSVRLCRSPTQVRSRVMGDKHSQEDQVITIEEFTERHWAQIREIARLKLDQNAYEGNQFKCTVAAFLEWLADQPFNVGIEITGLDNDPPTNLIM